MRYSHKFFSNLVPVAKRKWKNNSQNQRISGKGEPDAVPVFYTFNSKMIDDPAAANSAKPCAQPIGHDHKKPLRARTHSYRCFLFDKEGTGYIKKIECHAINDHRQDQEDKTSPRITNTKETKTEDPGKYTDQHDGLYAKTSQEKRDGENKQCLWNL